jgi:hypothetical protein
MMHESCIFISKYYPLDCRPHHVRVFWMFVGALSRQASSFQRIGTHLAGLALPTLLVLEGGYSLEHLGACVKALLDPFLARRQRLPRPPPAPQPSAQRQQDRRGARGRREKKRRRRSKAVVVVESG